jgi:hypothetical protein
MFVSMKKYGNELTEFKDYYLNYEGWMMDLGNKDVVKNISEHFYPVDVYESCFTEDDRKWMYGYAFSQCDTVRHNDNGTVFMSGNLQGVYEKFKDKIDFMLPGAEESPVVGGNYFLTPDQYGLHNDSTRKSDWETRKNDNSCDRKYVPWRNLLIPLWTCPKDVVSHFIGFDQRHIDFAHVYNNKGKGATATTYPIVYDHKTIDFHLGDGSLQDRSLNDKPYDKEHYDKYASHTRHNRLEGLTPETTCEWTPGGCFSFDAFQLHLTNKGWKEGPKWTTKLGLLLTFLREVK